MTPNTQGVLADLAQSHAHAMRAVERRIVICAGTGCLANGARAVQAAFVAATQAFGVACRTHLEPEAAPPSPFTLLSGSGCQGFCQMGPLVTVEPEGIMYCRVRPEDVEEIVGETLVRGRLVERLLFRDPGSHQACRGAREIPFYARQDRRVLAGCGSLDPESIEEYIHGGGYAQAFRAYRELEPVEICRLVTAAGLRGRGGGGFPTGRKWDLARVQEAATKYVICNGDEGDPGAFMDRSLMEGNPHRVLEGMMIAGRAVGAQHGVVYVRAEYPLAVSRMRRAVDDARRCGLLGRRVLGRATAFDVEVMEGAGAFVCGEETAMMASIEGRRGMPAPKPPFPAERGLHGCPTVINNVETLASIPLILEQGPDAYRAVGTAGSPGTKTFALTGHVANTGLIEVPFGTTLREIVNEIGGGVTDAAGAPLPDGLKAVQIGGPSGGCLTREHLDLGLDFDSLRGVGAMVGSGGLVVMNRHTCMVSVARYFMAFTQNESCGKCVPCREGTRQMLALLDDIVAGEGTPETLALLEVVAHAVGTASLCGLGKTAPNPVLSTLRQFRAEYEAHVYEKRCPAGECKALRAPSIAAERCKGCGRCLKVCPASAIRGARREPHTIDAALCIKCGACLAACKLDAITL